MTRDQFLTAMRHGLKGLPASTVEELVADYETHFAEAQSAGRSEAAVAEALGDPARLARELKAAVGLKRWEEERNPGAAVGAIFAVLGLATLDLLILLPVLLVVGSVLFALVIASIAVFGAGGAVVGAGLFGAGPVVAPFQLVFVGLGLMSGAAAAAALLMLAVVGLVNLLVHYGRLHFRLLKPAVQS
jgi:uncharacterized membrane protein